MRTKRTAVLVTVAAMLGLVVPPASVAQDGTPTSARTWRGRAEAIEQYLRDAEVVAIEDVGVGVTNPKRAELAPGGPADRISFKPIRPGNYRGHFESYTSEIAAYELDKFLDLGMIPPTVEKRIGADVGAAVMWASPVQSFKEMGGPPSPPPAQLARWNYQLIRAKMFHNLIYNKDPNLGNWLVDPAWNLILIDNSRAFTSSDRMVHKLTRVDQDLWNRFMALDESALQATLGDWLGGGEIRAILKRRDKMADEIEKLVDERGVAAVFVKYALPQQSAVADAQPPADAAAGLLAVGGRLLSVFDQAPVVMAGSELTWVGTVVPLEAYRGPDRGTAQAGIAAGHEYGILTEVDGLLCLTRDPQNPEHYERLTEMLGEQAEVFGLITDDSGLTVVQVTLCRESP